MIQEVAIDGCNLVRNDRNTEAAPRRCSIKKGVLKNFAKSTGKHLCPGLFLNNVAGLRDSDTGAFL